MRLNHEGTKGTKDMHDIEIKISGGRGVGCTTQAILIGRLLRSLGMQVSYRGYNGTDSLRIKADSDCCVGPLERRKILIIDRGNDD